MSKTVGIIGREVSEARKNLFRAGENIIPQKPDCIIAGCTEIGLALNGASNEVPIINPLDCLAKGIVEFAFSV